MEAPSAAFWLNLLTISLILVSLAAWLPIAVRWHNEGSVLPYEPRKHVPWDFIGAAPAVLFVILAFVNAIASHSDDSRIDIDAVLWGAIGGGIVLLALVVAASLVVVFVAGGNRSDLGLPRDAAQLYSDVFLGVCCWLAALLPVFIVQWVSSVVFGEESQNPVVNQIREHRDWRMFAAAVISAVVVAPIFEEFVFRLLFQGWLERVEDRAVGNVATRRQTIAVPALSIESTSGSPDGTIVDPILLEPNPPRGFLPGISHGFIPIALSSLLFSLAHIGFGPDPVALFVLALFLGYLYQRTHRIVPCIVVHVLFNALNLLMLWLFLQSQAP
jgi:membrane protease YdiL (CAAX protease family)